MTAPPPPTDTQSLDVQPAPRSTGYGPRSTGCGRRVVVVGVTGSGKSTLARALARRLGVPHVELDALFWGPNWTQAAPEAFEIAVDQALAGEAWVADGNYSRVRHLIWRRADTLVWLNFPLRLVLWRLARRTFRRGLTRQELWNGNREHIWEHFVTRESLFLWALRKHPEYERDFPGLLARPEHAHLRVHRFRSPTAARAWLKTVVPGERERNHKGHQDHEGHKGDDGLIV